MSHYPGDDVVDIVGITMSWDRLSGPYERGTPESMRAMLNDPIVANRGDIHWRQDQER